jgi:DNA-binding CsgD family transcriptional regulator
MLLGRGQERQEIDSALARAQSGASASLAATGEKRLWLEPSTIDELTPQELQIALLLAEGRTTRETATALFLSPKTVEYHLRHVYQKLDIHSRDELAQALARPAPQPTRPATPGAPLRGAGPLARSSWTETAVSTTV